MQQFSERDIDGVVVVSAVGAIDMLTAPQLQEVIDAAADRKPAALILDMTEVDFLASAGMRVLVMAQRRVGDEARFVVVADGPATSRPLKITGLTDHIELFSTLDVALQSVRS